MNKKTVQVPVKWLEKLYKLSEIAGEIEFIGDINDRIDPKLLKADIHRQRLIGFALTAKYLIRDSNE